MRINSGRKHQGRETDNRHLRCNAVVVGRIALRDSQCLAAALRRTDKVVEPWPLTVQAFDENHRRIVSLLHLHVAEVLDCFVAESPVVA